MDGVTVLNTYMEYSNHISAIMVLVGAISLIMFFVGGYIKFDTDSNWGCALSAIGLIILIYTFIYMPKTQFIQATIDNSVSWVELTNKYEIIKSEGQIITMIEKEQKNDSN